MGKKAHKLRRIVGIIAALVSIVFGIWLFLLMLGYNVTVDVFDNDLSFVEFLRLIAEITIGALIVAALAFL